MRLIDAGLVLDNLSGRLENMKDYDAVKDVINNMPTAYDPDKVVEQLEIRKTKATTLQKENISEYFEGETDAFEFAIKIVKGGGVE